MTFFLPIVIDDFLSFESMTIIGECITVARKNVQPGYVRTDLDRPVLHLPRKKNKVHYIESEQISPVLVEIKKKIKATFKEHNLKLPSMFELGTPQLSFYAPGDYYAQHKDKTELGITFLLFPSKKTFSGGKIKFHECNGISTNYKKNRAVIFSSETIHEVTKVTGKGTRVSLQFFLTSDKAQKRFHDEIVMNRKALKKNLVLFANRQDLDLEEVMNLKAEILQFKNGTLEGVYQYLYFACKNKLPSKVTSRIENKDGLSVIVSSKGDFELKVCVHKKRVWTEISIGEKNIKFDFLILAGTLAKEMKRSFKA